MRLISALATATVVGSLLLTGCGGDDDSKKEADPTSAEDAARATDCTVPPDSEEAGLATVEDASWAPDIAEQIGTALAADEVRLCIDASGMPFFYAYLDEAPKNLKQACKRATKVLDGGLEDVTTLSLVVDDEATACPAPARN